MIAGTLSLTISTYLVSCLIRSVACRVCCVVRIEVTNPVVVVVPAKESKLPCSVKYKHTDEEVNVKVNMTWTRDHKHGPPIIWKRYDGKEFPAVPYKNSVEFGDGCSLIIKNPNSTHAGVYTVTIDTNLATPAVSEDVELKVFNETSLEYSSNQSDDVWTDGRTITAEVLLSVVIFCLILWLIFRCRRFMEKRMISNYLEKESQNQPQNEKTALNG